MRPPTISLDTSQWHALSEAAKDEPRNPHDLKLLVQLRELADRQEIMLPLSCFNYFELAACLLRLSPALPLRPVALPQNHRDR
jgi:hypothetical protein